MVTAAEISNKSWQGALPDVQLTLNCTLNRVTKSSPLELLIRSGRIDQPLEVMMASDVELDVGLEQVRKDAVASMENNSDYDIARFYKTKAKIVSFSVVDFALLQRGTESNED